MAALVKYEVLKLIGRKLKNLSVDITSFLKQMYKPSWPERIKRSISGEILQYQSTIHSHNTSRIDDQSLNQIVSTATNMVRCRLFMSYIMLQTRGGATCVPTTTFLFSLLITSFNPFTARLIFTERLMY